MTVAVAEPVESVRDVFGKESLPGWDRIEELCEVYRVAHELKELDARLRRVRSLGGRFKGVSFSPHVRRMMGLLEKASV